MNNMNAIDTTEAKQKLANFTHKEVDRNHPIVSDFAKFLATRLNPRLVPIGFIMACELALYDLEKGVDGFTQKPITSRLVGYPPAIYRILRLEIPKIAEGVFPSEFADSVKTEWNLMLAEQKNGSPQ
jgi:hypothetical protein